MAADSGAEAQELPSEIIYLIVQALRANQVLLQQQGDTNLRRKKGLAACSLTCRYWSEILRPLLFGSLTLRGPEDMTQLLGFLQISPLLADCIWDLQINQSSQGYPWFHHVTKLLAFLREDAYVSLMMDNSTLDPLPGTVSESKSVSSKTRAKVKPVPYVQLDSLPRALPSSVLQMLTRITIRDLRLRRKSDLVRFVHGLSTLRSCAFRGVKFLQSTPVEPAQALGRTSRLLHEVEVSQCQDDNGLVAQMDLAASVFINSDFPFDGETWTQAVRAFLSLSLDPSYCRVRVSVDASSKHSSRDLCEVHKPNELPL